MIRQLAHLCLKTSRLPEMIAFYEGKLGASIRFRYLNRAGECVGCYVALGENTFVEIFDHAAADRRKHPERSPLPLAESIDPWLLRYNHFCLQVDDLDAWVKTLTTRAVEVTGQKIGNDRSRQAWVTDPDGNLLEFQEYTPQSRQITGEDFQEA